VSAVSAVSSVSAEQRVRDAYARIAEVDRPEVWITLRPESDVLTDAHAVDARVATGEVLPLAGLVVAVKDNIDVAGLPTTAGCPAFAYQAAESAPAVARLLAAGAVVLGKTNLDQFATGLVGTRSPYGAVRDARRPEYVSGGSSSGSAVAVALGITDIALGTDTAGSGRVPAAFGGIVGLKPTRGLVPTAGVVPACRTLDCVSVFAPTVALAERAVDVMTGPDPSDPQSRSWPPTRPLGPSGTPRIAIPLPDQLAALTPDWQAPFDRACDTVRASGALVEPFDIAPLLAAGQLLYGGAFVAERYAAVGDFLRTHPNEVDPTVRDIVLPAAGISAAALVADTERLDDFRAIAASIFAAFDALLLPTVPEHPAIAEVAADPVGVNARLGRYTTFCNLLDLAALAVPAGMAGEAQFGVSFVVPAFADAVATELARRFLGESASREPAADAARLVVVGAHLSGLALNHQLTDRGARRIGEVHTAPTYRLFALGTDPPKPGLVRVDGDGASIAGELWELPPTALASLLKTLPPPMTFGSVQLSDGSTEVGFLCETVAVVDARDITEFGGWRAYCASL
jgi:allophanate hydrolase